MTIPVLTFFSNKGGIGKTSLVYHVAWMMSNLNRNVLVSDLDPQANLTAAFLDEDALQAIWEGPSAGQADTLYRCVEPLTKVGDIVEPRLRRISDRLTLLPGDPALSGFEDYLATEWPNSLSNQTQYGPIRALTSFWQVLQKGAIQCKADIVLVDVGPSLGAINRSAFIASDFLLLSLAAELFSLQGLQNLGPTLRRWRADWAQRLSHWPNPESDLPQGRMQPLGYFLHQDSLHLSRPIAAHSRWLHRIPIEYARSVLGQNAPAHAEDLVNDPNCVASVKHYRSLIALGQDARKPIFQLTAADGAIGSHAAAAQAAYTDFRELCLEILHRVCSATHSPPR